MGDWRTEHWGFPVHDWLAAKSIVRRILVDAARHRRLLVYVDEVAAPLFTELPQVDLRPFPQRMDAMAVLLGQISIAEYEAGRPLLSAVVVNKTTGLPSWNTREGGFYGMVRDFTNRESSDGPEATWARELGLCHTYWSAH